MSFILVCVHNVLVLEISSPVCRACYTLNVTDVATSVDELAHFSYTLISKDIMMLSIHGDL